MVASGLRLNRFDVSGPSFSVGLFAALRPKLITQLIDSRLESSRSFNG